MPIVVSLVASANSLFRDAPQSALELKNPFTRGDAEAIRKGNELFNKNCASCHGKVAQGNGLVPSLTHGPIRSASDGEVFWFIEKGSIKDGMPPSTLPPLLRWQIVTYLRSLSPDAKKGSGAKIPETIQFGSHSGSEDGVILSSQGIPPPPFTDYRFEKPGQVHKILSKDLPPPAPDTSVGNAPDVVPRPKNAWPKVPAGFLVQLFADGLDNPRLIRTAPNGDIFLAESSTGMIRVFRGMTKEGKPKQKAVFLTGLNQPYGIAFYPPGAKSSTKGSSDPQWIYIGSTDAVLRYPYRNGDLHVRGPAQKIADLPHSFRGHWTRDIQFSLDGKKLFVAVGSNSNIDDPDTTPGEKDRADILAMDPNDGSDQRIYASGIRNAGGGLAVNPANGELWCSVNERDGLGDNLVPDYITHVEEGGFYGWPWWYMGANPDPRHLGKHPELKNKVLEPDVLLQPHNASLQLTFYTPGKGKSKFPSEFSGDIFASQHGSWNRSIRTGYELIRVPLHQKGKASGEYEDFMTGFVIDNTRVWGRPVGVTVAPDGSLLVSDDGSNSIWRISSDGATSQRSKIRTQ